MSGYFNHTKKLRALLQRCKSAVLKYTAGLAVIVYFSAALHAQPNITRVEYYIDTDPGYGKGTALSIVPAKNLPNLSFNIDLTPLYEGVHFAAVRSQDANGAWSLDSKYLFLKPYKSTSGIPQPNISYVEYYLDKDPGYGKATPLTITPGKNLSAIPFNINMAPLYEGVHIVGVRSRDVNGAWSLDNHFIFLKPYKNNGAVPQPVLKRVEYYIDKDPGYGKATALNITAVKDIGNVSININFAALSQGVHVVGIRSLDANGAWSLDNHWVFLKPYSLTGITQPDISAVEYFVDKDPGYGKATQVTITPGKDLSGLSFVIDLTKIGNGVHKVGVRTKDANGAWSIDNKFVMNGGSLPVELIAFNAEPEKNDVKVTWSTATENNSKDFVIQRSLNGSVFEDAGTVAAAGNSSTIRNYNFIDVQAMQYHANVLYYRLKQVDLDNRTRYSGVRKILIDASPNTLKLQYNPVQQQAVLLYITGENGKAVIQLTDMAGRVILQKEYSVTAGLNTITLQTGNITAGIYNIQLINANDKQFVRMLKE